MDWIIWIAALIMIGSTITNIRIRSQITRALEGKPTTLAKMIEEPKPAHRLIRTWIVSSQEGNLPPGWRWKCSCAVWGIAEDVKRTGNSYVLGSESRAIEGFKDHAKMYGAVNGDVYKQKWEQTENEFAEYRKLCYCKETNDSLLPWKGL